MTANNDLKAVGAAPRRLFVYNGGFLTQRRIRRILELSGFQIRLGKPGAGDLVGVWGKSPTAPRGETVAQKTKTPVLRVEDALLRSLHPGRDGEPPVGLMLDESGVHFDSSTPSDLEKLLASHPLDDTALLDRARNAIAHLARAHLSKYNDFDPTRPAPDAPYVLVIDQTRGDASITYGGADAATFKDMLVCAQVENPGSRVIIKTHPETEAGHRAGYFGPEDESTRVRLLRDGISPWSLFEGATAVYTVSSQMGFEAIFAGHKPHVFGQPFYCSWGLSNDRNPVARRSRKLTRAQLFAAAMILYPVWYDPYRDTLCRLETAIATLQAQTKAYRSDRQGHIAVGMRLWKRRPLQQMFGAMQGLRFENDLVKAVDRAKAEGRDLLVWAGNFSDEAALRPAAKAANVSLARVEDGFLRSKGLGANLIAPLSLVVDDLGIYYDPTRESRLERLIGESGALTQGDLQRAERLITRLVTAGVSKYNLTGSPLPPLPDGQRILVPGQVEDDASITLGCGPLRSNLELLKAAREANPTAVILYKPHPDVEAGLRLGALPLTEALTFADLVLQDSDPISILSQVDAVWTLTSLLGFEALLRSKPVTCLGAPFYAGWGLTTDQGPTVERRSAQPSLVALVHAVLIDYPRYFDPVTGQACPVEVVVDRLASGRLPRAGLATRSLAKLQGVFASKAHLWRH